MIKRLARFLFRVVLWFIGITILWVLVYRFLPVPVTYLMLQRCVEQMADEKAELRLKKDWEPLENISPNLQLAVVAAEDQNFLNHSGFDTDAIEKAMKYNERQKKRGRTKMRGASTISQQTAKNVFLWPGRSMVRKGFEVYFTLLIELLWSKERIMEVYLNVAEFGPGVYGAEAAAQFHFGKPASKLSVQQAALLAAVLPSPLRYKAGKPGPYVQRRAAWIVRQMNQLGGRLAYPE